LHRAKVFQCFIDYGKSGTLLTILNIRLKGISVAQSPKISTSERQRRFAADLDNAKQEIFGFLDILNVHIHEYLVEPNIENSYPSYEENRIMTLVQEKLQREIEDKIDYYKGEIIPRNWGKGSNGNGSFNAADVLIRRLAKDHLGSALSAVSENLKVESAVLQMVARYTPLVSGELMQLKANEIKDMAITESVVRHYTRLRAISYTFVLSAFACFNDQRYSLSNEGDRNFAATVANDACRKAIHPMPT
jgi:hypothetical protein